MKQRILVFNGYYIPSIKYGGPTKSLENIVNNCSEHFDFYIVAANHDFNDTKIFTHIHEGWNEVGKAKVLYVNKDETRYSIVKIRQIIEEVQPALVCLTGILTPSYKIAAIITCNKLHIPTIIAPRGEVCVNTFAMKKMKKSIYAWLITKLGIYNKSFFHATSPEEKEGLIKYFKVKENKITLIPNISEPPSSEYPFKLIKEKNKLRIVFISRIQEKKNLLYAINLVNQLKDTVVFDIYGPIESVNYWSQCQELMQSAPSNIKYNYCGNLRPEEVAGTFQKYDVFLFPTISENYGHVIVEAISNRCPVILSKGTTPWDDLDSRAGYVVSLNEPLEFVERLTKMIKMDSVEYEQLMVSTTQYYASKIIENNAVQGHIDMYSNVIELFHS